MTSWQAWAPPLDPPKAGGLPADEAEAIAAAWWDSCPHLAAALMWESWAAMLPPAPAVASVATGAQNVAYSPALPLGEVGLAIARAAWHRSFCEGLLMTAELQATPGHPVQVRAADA